MLDDCIALSDIALAERPHNTRIAYHDRQYIDADTFRTAVSHWVTQLQAQSFQRYALYTEDAYPFAVLLFALFHAGKEVWIPGNNRPGTAEQLLQQGCQLIGDWNAGQPFDYQLTDSTRTTFTLSALNPAETKLVIFTSGSTGQPKPIAKRLIQLQNEIAVLEQLWGMLLGDSEALSTVSHQHIYGLLFRILWPLSAGRCFHSSIYLNPEILSKNINSGAAYWVASPAHLKRLDQDSPWRTCADMSAIFSSGSALNEVVRQQIHKQCGQQVIEIYGSSETGGIAWKAQDKAWTLFPGMSLSEIDGNWHLLSPYLPEGTRYQLDDHVTVLDDGRFTLNDRSDRIVKVEEKRLSLNELEQHLIALPLVAEAHTLVLNQKRDAVGAVAVLTQQGLQILKTQGRSRLIRQVRKGLEAWFEPVVLPRKWLFVNRIPLTQQGKIDHTLLTTLLGINKEKLPSVLTIQFANDSVEIGLKVPQEHELVYFPDHFPGYPILPGVIQLAWVDYFGKLFFDVESQKRHFSHLEVVKFIQIIHPGAALIVALNWKESSGELNFNFSSDAGGYSSGRMVYK